jgi:hypothetical protein
LGGSSAWIDFRGAPGTIRSVSLSDVLEGKIEPGVFRDRIVVVGPAVPTLPGSQFTPTSGNELMSGPELIGNGIWTALHGFQLRSAPGRLTLGLIVLFGLLAPVVSLRLRLLPMLAFVLLTIAGYCVSTQVAFERGLILSFVYPLCALVLSISLRDERGDLGPRRHAHLVSGRRHHGRLRRADRAERPRRPRACAATEMISLRLPRFRLWSLESLSDATAAAA